MVINELIIQTQINIYICFHNWINKLFSEENEVPVMLFEAGRVAGSATYRQSNTAWHRVLSFTVSLFHQSWKQREFFYFVCWRFSLLIKMSSSELHTAPLKRRNRQRWNETKYIYSSTLLNSCTLFNVQVLQLHSSTPLHFGGEYCTSYFTIFIQITLIREGPEAIIAFWIFTYFVSRISNCLKGNILTKSTVTVI